MLTGLQVKDAMESRYNVSLTLTDATLREGAAGKDVSTMYQCDVPDARLSSSTKPPLSPCP